MATQDEAERRLRRQLPRGWWLVIHNYADPDPHPPEFVDGADIHRVWLTFDGAVMGQLSSAHEVQLTHPDADTETAELALVSVMRKLAKGRRAD